MNNRNLTDFIIEKNIPITPRGGRPNNRKYPFLNMEIGDSFLVPTPADKKIKRRVQYNISASALLLKSKGLQFITRTEQRGVRCWRVK